MFSVKMRYNRSNPSGGPYNFGIEEGSESHLQLHLNHKICIFALLFFSLNHFPVTIASLKEEILSFDKEFLISIFSRPKYLSFSCLSFRHVKNPSFFGAINITVKNL